MLGSRDTMSVLFRSVNVSVMKEEAASGIEISAFDILHGVGYLGGSIDGVGRRYP